MPASRTRTLVSVVTITVGAIAVGLTAARPAAAQTASAQTVAAAPSDTSAPAPRDGQHDFDWMAGSWKADLKRLVNPLTGSTQWLAFEGTQRTMPLFGGRGWMDEFVVDNPAAKSKVEGLTVRLYNPANQTWSIYWSNMKSGAFSMPATVGRWKDGRGEFYDHEELNGRWILVRYVWSDVTATAAHFEQAFSEDGGKTWEVNWISNITRVKPAS
jgi:hypothetical protein